MKTDLSKLFKSGKNDGVTSFVLVEISPFRSVLCVCVFAFLGFALNLKNHAINYKLDNSLCDKL